MEDLPDSSSCINSLFDGGQIDVKLSESLFKLNYRKALCYNVLRTPSLQATFPRTTY